MKTKSNQTVSHDQKASLKDLQARYSQLEQHNAQSEARFSQLEQRYEQNEARYAQLAQHNARMEQRSRNERRRFRVQMGLALVALIGAVLLSPANRTAIAQDSTTSSDSGSGTGGTVISLDPIFQDVGFPIGAIPISQPDVINQLAARLTAVENKTRYLSVDAHGDTWFTGTNVYVVNGSGSTDGAVNTKGNLIIGYNEARNTWYDPDDRSGSHNLIVGKWNNYSSYGGVVFGAWNSISGQCASVSGGCVSTASGDYSSSSGGVYNIASGLYASISGGAGNTASGYASSVSGGYANIASGNSSSISGGLSSTASGICSSVSGGYQCFASSDYNWAAGGLFQSQ